MYKDFPGQRVQIISVTLPSVMRFTSLAKMEALLNKTWSSEMSYRQ